MHPAFVSSPIAALIFTTTCVVWLVPELIYSRSRRPGPEAHKQDRFSGLLLGACIGSAIYVGIVAAFRLPQFAIPWHRTVLFAGGIALMLAGVAFRWYAIHVLGRYFTPVVVIQPEHSVVENGPYRWIRHPSYSGALLTFLGYTLVLGNWVSMDLVVAAVAIGYAYRIAVEERALLDALGEPYRAYMKRTKRIIPFVI